MKNINKIIRTASVGIALAMVFTIAFAAPASAHAYNYSYSTPTYTVSNSGYNYSYNYSRPVPYSYPVSYPVYYPVYQQPVVTPVYYYPSLTVSCYANPISVSTGQNVTWEAYASGGNGIYSYNWNGMNNSYGTNGSYNTGSTAYSTYYTPGSYTASVTVYSNGQSVTESCGYVSVIGSYSYNYAPTYAYNYPTAYEAPTYPVQTVSGNLVAACFADRTTATVGTPVTWSVEVTGGTGQYAYQWSGSDGLDGTAASAVQAYSTTGLKNADVLISSRGQTISQACGDSVDVRSYVSPTVRNYQGPTVTPTPTPSVTPSANPNSLSAAALLGLGSIPWGWIAILIIIVLGVAVFYLLFNRHNKA